jgi:hypothetical protein
MRTNFTSEKFYRSNTKISAGLFATIKSTNCGRGMEGRSKWMVRPSGTSESDSLLDHSAFFKYFHRPLNRQSWP